MAAHLTRDAGGPPLPTRNEALLREAVDRLRRELDECWAQRDENLANVRRMDDLRMAEIARLRQVVNQISVLLDTSPIGPTRADLATLVFQIRQVIDAAREAEQARGGK